jgi:hypothetical protein
MALDWISNLFQSEQTRGLSGDSATAVALDDANPYYNYRLRRHKAEGDIVANPALVWSTSATPTRRGGLGVHVASEKGEGVATFTDVLVILSADDHERAMQVGFPEPWSDKLARSVQHEFTEFCRRESFALQFPERRLSCRVVRDGGPEMAGLQLGLCAGEFVTGLVPNHYAGPAKGSYPIIAIHLNLPDLWDGYREVGRLYSDQILFTIGSHWLDNFSHASLREGALYRLKQYPDGTFLHMVNPDLQEQYLVSSSEESGGASVITLATRSGTPLAYIVLAVLDPPSEAVAPPMLIDDLVQPAASGAPLTPSKAHPGQKTIIPEAPSERLLTLQERGALLQKVHFAAFMEGYDVYVGTRGELGTVVDEKAATFQVRKKRVSLLSHGAGVRVDGHDVPGGVELPLDGDAQIEAGGSRFDYRDLREIAVDGWPYVGEIRRPASSSYLVWGTSYRVGRARDCRVVLPDEPRNDNIHWKPGIADGTTIRARSGEVPKSKFYTDSIMVGSEHAELDLSTADPQLRCLHRQCYVYIRRGDEVIALYPTDSGREAESRVLPGDELLVGNCVFHAGYASDSVVTVAAPAPRVEFSSDVLLGALAEVDVTPAPQAVPPVAAEVKPAAPAKPAPPLMAVPLEFEDEQTLPPSNLWKGGASPAATPKRFSTAEESVLPPPRQKLDVSPPTRPAHFTPEPPAARLAGPSRAIGAAPSRGDEDADEPPPFVAPPTDAAASPRSVSDPPPVPTRNPFGAGLVHPTSPARPVSPPPLPPRASPPSVSSPPPVPNVPRPPVSPAPPPVPAAPPPVPAAPPPLPAAPPPPGAPPPPVAPPPVPVAPPPVPVAPPPLVAPPPVPVAPPPVAAAPPVAAPPVATADEPGGFGDVVVVDEAEAQFELGRKCQIVQVGWAVNGTVVCGNHKTADLQIPETRIEAGQTFAARDYFALKIRGRRGVLEIVDAAEVLIDGASPTVTVYDEPEKVAIDVIRRDDEGFEDFSVRLQIREDRALPDPRARLIAIDPGEPLAAALFTRGLPTRQPRTLDLGGIVASFMYDGEAVAISDYLGTYLQDSGFQPFFVQHGGERFQTAPEDGAAIQVRSGDRLVIGNRVFVVKSS